MGTKSEPDQNRWRACSTPETGSWPPATTADFCGAAVRGANGSIAALGDLLTTIYNHHFSVAYDAEAHTLMLPFSRRNNEDSVASSLGVQGKRGVTWSVHKVEEKYYDDLWA